MVKTNLTQTAEQLRSEAGEAQGLEILATENDLTLTYNPQTGFEEFEQLITTKSHDAYVVDYYGMSNAAKKTYERLLPKNVLLRDLGKKIKVLANAEDSEIFSRKSEDIYEQVIEASATTASYRDLIGALREFSRIFVQKSREPKQRD